MPRTRWLRRAQVEGVGELADDVDELLDLGLRVRRGDLDPESDLALRHERVRSQRDVDAVLEEEAPAASMSSWRASGTSMIGKPERFGVWMPSGRGTRAPARSCARGRRGSARRATR
jgi:hypothetical protein